MEHLPSWSNGELDMTAPAQRNGTCGTEDAEKMQQKFTKINEMLKFDHCLPSEEMSMQNEMRFAGTYGGTSHCKELPSLAQVIRARAFSTRRPQNVIDRDPWV